MLPGSQPSAVVRAGCSGHEPRRRGSATWLHEHCGVNARVKPNARYMRAVPAAGPTAHGVSCKHGSYSTTSQRVFRISTLPPAISISHFATLPPPSSTCYWSEVLLSRPSKSFYTDTNLFCTSTGAFPGRLPVAISFCTFPARDVLA